MSSLISSLVSVSLRALGSISDELDSVLVSCNLLDAAHVQALEGGRKGKVDCRGHPFDVEGGDDAGKD